MAGTGARYFFLFLVGLVAGVICTIMAMRALEARKDPFHESVMHVQQWHMAQLKGNTEQNRCNATDTLPHLLALRTMADDIEPAFPELRDDARFAKAASQLRAALDSARANPPLNCAGVGAAMKDIGAACKTCHQDFRG